MEIKTLKDLKHALKDVPDEILEDFGAGYIPEFHEEGVTLLCWTDESDFSETWDRALKIAPQINDILAWVTNISNVARAVVKDDDYDGAGSEDSISSKDFKKE